MNSRGQVTLFIIIGIVALLAAGIYYATSSRPAVRIMSEGAKTTFSEVQDSASMFVSECLKKTSILAVHEYGLDPSFSPERMKRYVESHLKECTQKFEDFKRYGYEVTEGILSSDVTVNDNIVQVKLTYPVVFKKGNIEFELKDFTYTLDRTVTEKVIPGGDTLLQSSDGSMRIRVPAGTKVYLGDKETDTVGIRLLDKHFEGLSNSVVPGMVVFEGVPDGATFDKEVELTIWYDDRDINPAFPEEDIRVGYYDRSRGVWWGLPTEVDAEKNQLTIKTTHFSPYATTVHCNPGIEKEFTIPFDIVVNDAEPCDDWNTYDIGKTDPQLDGPRLWTANSPHTKGAGSRFTVYVPSADYEYYTESSVWATKDLGNSCTACHNCDYLDPATHQTMTKKCLECGDYNSPGCEKECKDGFNYFCEEVYYYDTTLITGTAKHTVIFEGSGNSCIPLGEDDKWVEDAIGEFGNENTKTGAIGTDILSVTPVCHSGECRILGSEAEKNEDKPILTRNDEGNPTFSFSIEANNIAPSECFKASATVKLKGIGLTEGEYYCTPGQAESGELTFINGECMMCVFATDSEGKEIQKYIPSKDCGDYCTEGLVGTTRLTETDCQMCTKTGTKYKFENVDRDTYCAKCLNVFAENPDLPKCVDIRDQCPSGTTDYTCATPGECSRLGKGTDDSYQCLSSEQVCCKIKPKIGCNQECNSQFGCNCECGNCQEYVGIGIKCLFCEPQKVTFRPKGQLSDFTFDTQCTRVGSWYYWRFTPSTCQCTVPGYKCT